ncbi:MAG: EI24 domain-containing protein [Bacteroidota bacterium]
MIKDLFAGVQSYGKALQLISKLGLWGYVLLPGLFSLLLAAAIGVSAWSFSGSIGSWLMAWYPFEWGSELLAGAANFIGLLLIVTGGLIVYKHLVMVIVSPFMSPLSEKVENYLMGEPLAGNGLTLSGAIGDLIRGLRIALRNIIRELFLVGILFLLSWIPILTPFTTALIFIVQAYYAGAGNMDYLLERHYSVRGSVRFVRDYRGLAVGNGSIFLLLLMTGIGFLIAPPLGTIAATIEGVKRLE